MEALAHIFFFLVALLIWRKWANRMSLFFKPKPIMAKVGEAEVIDDFDTQTTHIEAVMSMVGRTEGASRLEKTCCITVFIVVLAVISSCYFLYFREISNFYAFSWERMISLNWSASNIQTAICVIFVLFIFVLMAIALLCYLFFVIFITTPPIVIYRLGIFVAKIITQR